MKLAAVQVQNFKCIDDSNQFRVDDITCLVGKNEAGKTVLLQALYKLNPVAGSSGYDKLLDYPRRRLSEYEERLAAGAPPDPVVRTMWELEATDVEAFEAVFGSDALSSTELTISRDHGTDVKYQFQLDEKRIVQNFLEAAKLHQEERAPLEGLTDVAGLLKSLEESKEKSERYTALLTRLKTALPKGSAHEAAINILQARLPKFLYFSEYYRMRGQISVTDVATRKANNQLKEADRVFLALLAMAGTSMDLDTSGRLVRIGQELAVVLNRRELPERRNFTLCHEIAHTFELEGPPSFRGVASVSCGQSSVEEYLCDRAAAEMLMPEKLFRQSAEALEPSIDAVSRLSESFAASMSATILRLGALSCWRVVFIVWKFATRLGSSPKLRVSWSVRPANTRCFVPKHASADASSGIYATFATARRTLRQETLCLGSLRGRHFVESARFGGCVLSIVHEPNLPREDRHAG